MSPIARLEISITGSVSTVCTSATRSADEVNCVIAQGSAGVLKRAAKIGEQAREPNAPEGEMAQRRRVEVQREGREPLQQ